MIDMQKMLSMRAMFDKAFSEDTAYRNIPGPTPSFGHCGLVAHILREEFGGEIYSCNVKGYTHRYNFISGTWCDLTADQFGGPAILFSDSRIYPGRHTIVSSGNSKEFLKRLLAFSARM